MTPKSSLITLLSAVTATTTSSTIRVGNAKKLALSFTAASITTGNGVFTVSVSIDGTNFVTYNRLVSNLANTNSQTDTRVASVTLNSNTTNVMFIPDADLFECIKVTVTRTTDGAYSAYLLTQEEG